MMEWIGRVALAVALGRQCAWGVNSALASQSPRQWHPAKLYYLPPYSPDLNPIENAFSTLKAGLKRIGAKTFEGLVQTVGQLLEATLASHFPNCFKHCGYA